MAGGEKRGPGNAGDANQAGGKVDRSETLEEALAKVGFEPAKVGPKIVSQGKRREALKKRVSKGQVG
ncbi:hypothetical protein LAC81_29565 [Ensifer adhaerens]|uniref:hypothetical protein n=1 Tax=Ensifer adhaerens TaxID=106592 RepID=UPI001CC1389E|nr:hypothetical protein [Ensifer adhaerens]MBZ7924888.1 hypothetical protein [Ensifer adhaerens]UAX95897.1 hypothetical protein LAC78_34265 [Ensifer adhaerens]UAY04761.1 hypothetical protein LAC80_26045 [Ensifer adhaerens]UAY10192.1 hypothetical protein LAC81_29565 [Ensifer adhaerens]